MRDNPFDPGSLDELPGELAIFPLPGATLLPGTQLPLNIFEPRYLNMILDALAGSRLVGMVQPDPGQDAEQPPGVYRVGCAGRIVAFSEVEDGRLLITLKGVCRFLIRDELPLHRGYRRVDPDFSVFAADLDDDVSFSLDRDVLRASLTPYLDAGGLRVDWDGLEKLSDPALVDFLATHLPLSPQDKQILVEAPDVAARAQSLMAVIGIAVAATPTETRH